MFFCVSGMIYTYSYIFSLQLAIAVILWLISRNDSGNNITVIDGYGEKRINNIQPNEYILNL